MKTQKKAISILLTFCLLLSLFPSVTFAAMEASKPIEKGKLFTEEFLASASEHKFEGVPIDDIRRAVDDGEQIYQDFRVRYEDVGVVTYQVPMQPEEIDYMMSIQDESIARSSNANPRSSSSYHYTKIRDSGKSDADSIVIMLLGDGFTANEYGTWPNPAS